MIKITSWVVALVGIFLVGYSIVNSKASYKGMLDNLKNRSEKGEELRDGLYSVTSKVMKKDLRAVEARKRFDDLNAPVSEDVVAVIESEPPTESYKLFKKQWGVPANKIEERFLVWLKADDYKNELRLGDVIKTQEQLQVQFHNSIESTLDLIAKGLRVSQSKELFEERARILALAVEYVDEVDGLDKIIDAELSSPNKKVRLVAHRLWLMKNRKEGLLAANKTRELIKKDPENRLMLIRQFYTQFPLMRAEVF